MWKSFRPSIPVDADHQIIHSMNSVTHDFCRWIFIIYFNGKSNKKRSRIWRIFVRASNGRKFVFSMRIDKWHRFWDSIWYIHRYVYLLLVCVGAVCTHLLVANGYLKDVFTRYGAAFAYSIIVWLHKVYLCTNLQSKHRIDKFLFRHSSLMKSVCKSKIFFIRSNDSLKRLFYRIYSSMMCRGFFQLLWVSIHEWR